MKATRSHSRRRALAILGLGTAGILLAACGQGATPTADPSELPKPGRAPASPQTSTPSKPAQPAGPVPTTGARPQGIGLIKGPLEGEAKTLNGAGATFPAALYSKWHEEFFKLTGVKVNYQSIGSGGGIKSIGDGTVDFGATDGPMNDEQIRAARGEVLHVPMTMGAVVPTYNVPEAREALKFTADTLSGIYLGTITRWNDPRLVADNPALKDVGKDISVVYRADGSGTTFIWTDYLASVSPDWKAKVGNANSVKWPIGLGGKGNEGVAGEVKQSQYSIGYVELIYAVQNKLGVGQVRNASGKFVAPSLQSVTAAAAGIGDRIAPDLRASIVNAPGEEAFPISGFTWLLVYRTMSDKPKAQALTRLMWWSIFDGQQFCADLGYAPLPEAIQMKSADKILSINVNDQRAFPGA